MGTSTAVLTLADDVDPAAARLLTDAGWIRPDDDKLPTGAQLASDYLQPLADLPAV